LCRTYILSFLWYSTFNVNYLCFFLNTFSLVSSHLYFITHCTQKKIEKRIMINIHNEKWLLFDFHFISFLFYCFHFTHLVTVRCVCRIIIIWNKKKNERVMKRKEISWWWSLFFYCSKFRTIEYILIFITVNNMQISFIQVLCSYKTYRWMKKKLKILPFRTKTWDDSFVKRLIEWRSSNLLFRFCSLKYTPNCLKWYICTQLPFEFTIILRQCLL
jgi:hypothetical protein